MNRAIDRHEDAIVDVLEMTDHDVPYSIALAEIADANDLSTTRLDQLVTMWCALAGIPVPA